MNEQAIDHALEQSLQEMARTRSLQRALRRSSQHADTLRPLLRMAAYVGKHYQDVPPPPGELAAGRARLLAAAAQCRPAPFASTTHPSPQQWHQQLTWGMRLAAVLVAIAVSITAIGGGIAWAASDSLPSNLFYPAKLAVEDAQLALLSVPEAQVSVALQLLDRRVAEAEELLAAGNPVPEQLVARMDQHVRYALERAAEAPEETSPRLLERIAMRTRRAEQALLRLRETADEEQHVSIDEALGVCVRGNSWAVGALNGLEVVSWNGLPAPDGGGPVEQPTTGPEGYVPPPPGQGLVPTPRYDLPVL